MSSDALIQAIQDGDLAAVKAVSRYSPGDNQEVLHYAAKGGNVSIVSVLLESGWAGLIDSFDDVAFTPLMWASRGCHLEVVRVLLKYGADVNAHQEERIGNTALHEAVEAVEAVEAGGAEVIRELIKSGADPSIRGWMQLSPLDKAQQRFESLKSLEAKNILELLKTEHLR